MTTLEVEFVWERASKSEEKGRVIEDYSTYLIEMFIAKASAHLTV